MAKRLYVVHTHSKVEQQVAESLREQARQRGLAGLFDEVLSLADDPAERRGGQRACQAPILSRPCAGEMRADQRGL